MKKDFHAPSRRSVLVAGVALAGFATTPARAATLPSPFPALMVDVAVSGPEVSPSLFGTMLEDIQHSVTGGVYDELIENRSMRNGKSMWSPSVTPNSWSAVTQGGSTALVSLDPTAPLNDTLTESLRLDAGNVSPTARAGVANDGFYGIPLRPGATYKVSFFAKSDNYGGPLTVAVESDTGEVYAKATVPVISGSWERYSADLVIPATAPKTMTNRFVMSTADPSASGTTMWFNHVSLKPTSYLNADNGMRTDIMEKLKALKPAFLRLGGSGMNSALPFEDTIGPEWERPGHDNTWGYWSEDGWGLDEQLEMAQQLGAEPIITLYAGGPNGGATSSVEPIMSDIVEKALAQLHYLLDPPTTSWGAKRAANGHPDPYPIKHIQLGNEEMACPTSPAFPACDPLGSYPQRYAAMYEAIHPVFPDLKFISSGETKGMVAGQFYDTPTDVIDEHYYKTPEWFIANSSLFDHHPRTGPKIMVGEYASDGAPNLGLLPGKPLTSNLWQALGEAAWLLGLMRNSDLVTMATYAPTLVNVNNQPAPGALTWSPNSIGFDGISSFVSPSYHVQRMLAENHGNRVVSTKTTGTLQSVTTLDTKAGYAYVSVVNTGALPQQVDVKLTGLKSVASKGSAVELTGNPADLNSLDKPDNVAPTTKTISGTGKSFTYTFPEYSLTVLKLRVTT
ncbi:alpha-L-arabinofuranosidase C-terminal domain-containing protein [Pseudarthrobacter scleromae]|uniref:alpha-L-arabinofuranosidase C-terminal domain-containing protein n=1 Tax=Pseudarthrobacter scleromae TaxID=158897 RepID=UPI003CFFBFE5